jgi:protein involved in polysaccharide export with SLBB domain
MSRWIRLVAAVICVCWAGITQEVSRPAAGADAADYILGADDEIGVWVSGAEDLNGKPSRIDATGTVKLPLVGTIRAAGRTAAQLSADLTEKLDRYYQSPQVIVSVLS